MGPQITAIKSSLNHAALRDKTLKSAREASVGTLFVLGSAWVSICAS